MEDFTELSIAIGLAILCFLVGNYICEKWLYKFFKLDKKSLQEQEFIDLYQRIELYKKRRLRRKGKYVKKNKRCVKKDIYCVGQGIRKDIILNTSDDELYKLYVEINRKIKQFKNSKLVDEFKSEKKLITSEMKRRKGRFIIFILEFASICIYAALMFVVLYGAYMVFPSLWKNL